MSSMYNLVGWDEVECREADRVRGAQPVSPGSSLTDLDGEYGDPVMFTEWWADGDRPVLRDYLWHPLERGSDRCYCTHFIPAGGAA